MREKELGICEPIAGQIITDRARQVGVALLSLGMKTGDVAAIISEDNKEWVSPTWELRVFGASVTDFTRHCSHARWRFNSTIARPRFCLSRMRSSLISSSNKKQAALPETCGGLRHGRVTAVFRTPRSCHGRHFWRWAMRTVPGWRSNGTSASTRVCPKISRS